MAKLKSRTTSPPGGWQYTQPAMNFEVQNTDKNKSFDVVVNEVIKLRKANPHITKQAGLAVDYESVANEVDAYNAHRCMSRGWMNFVADTTGPPSWSPQRIRQNVAAAVGSVKKTAAGVKLVTEWLGSGLKPVAKELAEDRAAICVTCPKNQDPNWIQKLDAVAADEIKKLIEIRNDLRLETSHDKKLHTCVSCDCKLTLKVFAPLKHILDNTSAEVKAALNQDGPRCWILTEGEKKNESAPIRV